MRRGMTVAAAVFAVGAAGTVPGGSPALAAPAPAALAAPAARYAVTDLGALAGGVSGANAVNNAGVVVGVSTVDSLRQHAVRWSANGAITDLGLLPGGASSSALAVNDAGQVAGVADRSDGGFGYPVRWSAAGAITDLGGPITNRLGEADGIDPAGRVVGGQRPADSEGAPVGIRYGTDGAPTELGAGLELARGVNARGQIVGGPAYVWQAGRVTPLPDLTGGRSALAFAINVAGVVVGVSATADPAAQHAVRWAGGVPTDIGTVDGISYSEARAVNSAGQVVGTADGRCTPCAAPRAWIWQPGAPITALDTLLPAGSGWSLRAADGINDRGQIVGTGLHNGARHGYLLTPRFHANINFQPATAPVPTGYAADTGAAFGPRAGLTYGWAADSTANTRDRGDPAAPDQRYDTLIHLQKPGAPGTWELAVPAGSYLVHAVAGDPGFTDSVYRISVEGVPAVTGTPTGTTHWFEGTVRVQVTDGRLTVTTGAGAVNAKLDYLDVLGA
ncbi:MAG: hypothetical protein V7637_3018 [Mycobacteriales bacterium]